MPGDPLEELAEDRHFRRKWVRDTDSKYVKLAKGGGRKDLLAYRQQKPVGTPIDYPRVDWFDHVQPVEEEHLNELAAECNDKNSQTKPRYRVAHSGSRESGQKGGQRVFDLRLNF